MIPRVEVPGGGRSNRWVARGTRSGGGFRSEVSGRWRGGGRHRWPGRGDLANWPREPLPRGWGMGKCLSYGNSSGSVGQGAPSRDSRVGIRPASMAGFLVLFKRFFIFSVAPLRIDSRMGNVLRGTKKVGVKLDSNH